MEKKFTIEEIGLWSMRIVLIIGAIIAGIMGHPDLAGSCFVVTVLSFIFL